MGWGPGAAWGKFSNQTRMSNSIGIQPGSDLSGSQISILAIQFVIFECYVDILIAFGVAPSRAFVDKLVFRTGRSWRSKNRLNLLLRCLFADLIVVGAIELGNRVSIVAPHQKQNTESKNGEDSKIHLGQVRALPISRLSAAVSWYYLKGASGSNQLAEFDYPQDQNDRSH
jgi:hypothetical protein